MTSHAKKEKHESFKKHESSPHDQDHTFSQNDKKASPRPEEKVQGTEQKPSTAKSSEKQSLPHDAKMPVVLSSLGTEETELKAFFEQIVLPRLREQLHPYHDNVIPTHLLRHFQDLLNHIEKEFREFSHKLEHTTHSVRQGNKRAFKSEVTYLEHDLPNLKKNIETLVKEVEQAVKDAEKTVKKDQNKDKAVPKDNEVKKIKTARKK